MAFFLPALIVVGVKREQAGREARISPFPGHGEENDMQISRDTPDRFMTACGS